MATQPTARPLFGFASMARPAPPPAPTPEAQPPTTTTQPRPLLMRTTFTFSFGPPTTQTQEPAPPAPPPPPPVSAPPPPPSISAPSPSFPAAAVTGITTSVPSSPIGKKSIAPHSPSSTRIPISSSSVPPSPKPKFVVFTAPPFPNSPVPKNLSTTSSAQPNSPATKISSPISPVRTSPAPKIPSPSSFLQPTSRFSKAAPTSFFIQNSPPPPKAPISTTAAANAAIPPQFPTPAPSPKLTKQPLAQTPPQSEGENGPRIPLEAEQKTVLVQKTIDKPKPSWFNGDSQKDAHKPRIFRWGTNEKGSHNKKNFDPEEIGMNVITISGENRGAFMELSHAHKKHGHFEGNPHSLIKKNGNESDSSSNGKGKSKMKDQNHKKMATTSPPLNAFINSNVQGINNSIVFNSSCTYHDPGVHLSLSRKPNGGHKMFQFEDDATDHYHS